MRRLCFALGVAIAFLNAGWAWSQAYPSRPIRIVVGEPGGNTDFTARLLASAITGPLGQSVVIDNRPSSIIGDTVAKAQPDGYTILLTGNILWLQPLIQKTTYDPIKDFAPITLATRVPAVLVVHPSLPVRSVKELVALAKAHPGELNYNAGAIGGSAHLAGELFKALAGVNIVAISYKGSGPGLNALLAGEVQMTINNASSSMAYFKSGRLRALAVTSVRPSALFPDLPTVAATLPGYEAVTLFSILAPAGTPTPAIALLNQEIVRALNRPDLKEKFFNSGAEIVGSTPEEFAASIKSEMARMGKVIKDAGIRVD